MIKLRFTKKFEIELDSNKLKWFYMSCAAALPQLDRGSDYESERHRFESYTPHQLNLKPPATGAFLLRRHRTDSNLGRGAGVKKTRSVFSPRASPPAGGRSRCGSAKRMRGILYAAPIEIESLRQRGLFFYGGIPWIRISVEARASQSSLRKIFPNCRLTHRGVTCIIIRALRRYLSWIEGLTTNQNVIGSNPIRRTNWTLKPSVTEAFLISRCVEDRIKWSK